MNRYALPLLLICHATSPLYAAEEPRNRIKELFPQMPPGKQHVPAGEWNEETHRKIAQGEYRCSHFFAAYAQASLFSSVKFGEKGTLTLRWDRCRLPSSSRSDGHIVVQCDTGKKCELVDVGCRTEPSFSIPKNMLREQQGPSEQHRLTEVAILERAEAERERLQPVLPDQPNFLQAAATPCYLYPDPNKVTLNTNYGYCTWLDNQFFPNTTIYDFSLTRSSSDSYSLVLDKDPKLPPAIRAIYLRAALNRFVQARQGRQGSLIVSGSPDSEEKVVIEEAKKRLEESEKQILEKEGHHQHGHDC